MFVKWFTEFLHIDTFHQMEYSCDGFFKVNSSKNRTHKQTDWVALLDEYVFDIAQKKSFQFRKNVFILLLNVYTQRITD